MLGSVHEDHLSPSPELIAHDQPGVGDLEGRLEMKCEGPEITNQGHARNELLFRYIILHIEAISRAVLLPLIERCCFEEY